MMAGPRSEMISLSPEVLRWARRRARHETDELAAKLKVRPDQVVDWEGTGRIDIPMVRKLAEQTLTPFGYLLLDEPPYDAIKATDLRVARGSGLHDASSGLFATMMRTLRRQDWARIARFARGDSRLDFVSSCKHASPMQVAASLRKVLQLEPGWQVGFSVSNARKKLFEQMVRAGIFTNINGVVDEDSRFKLDPTEFKGFALVDEYAPFVFVNGRDALESQVFTLAHESAHILVGQGGVSLCDFRSKLRSIERVCIAAASEFLVPERMFKVRPMKVAERHTFIESTARRYCVSEPVIAHRAHDLKMLSQKGLEAFYVQYDERLAQASRAPWASGNYWSNLKFRLGHELGDSVVREVLAGRMPYTEGWGLTGLYGYRFDQYAERRRKHL